MAKLRPFAAHPYAEEASLPVVAPPPPRAPPLCGRDSGARPTCAAVAFLLYSHTCTPLCADTHTHTLINHFVSIENIRQVDKAIDPSGGSRLFSGKIGRVGCPCNWESARGLGLSLSLSTGCFQAPVHPAHVAKGCSCITLHNRLQHQPSMGEATFSPRRQNFRLCYGEFSAENSVARCK